MKIGVFADPHDCSSEVLCRTRRPRLSYEKVRELPEASGKVKLVLRGHYHPGAEAVVSGIPYLTVPALCEGEAIPFRILEI